MNNLSYSKIPKFLLAVLALFSMAFLVGPVSEINAQAVNRNICVNRNTGALEKADMSVGAPKCRQPSAGNDWYLYIGSPSDNGLCLTEFDPYNASSPNELSADGKYCITTEIDDDGNPVPIYSPYKPFASITAQYSASGGTTTTPPVTTTPGTKPGTTTPSTTPSTQSQGDCEAKFHKVGPLCVPNNPFNNDSIAGGDQTASSLAVKIIRIMLYFAAIVAVIMVIVGGYHVMTAGGNETQAANGRKTLTNALIGLGITVLAYIIVQVVINFLTK